MLTFARGTIMDKPVFDDNIPVPLPSSLVKYGWIAEMKVGQSFTCNRDNAEAIRQLTYNSPLRHTLPQGFALTIKRVSPDLCRVWRKS